MLRLNVFLGVVGLTILPATSVLANSDINSRFNSKYVASHGCKQCHGPGNEGNSGLNSYGASLTTLIGTSPSSRTDSLIDNALNASEPTYAPRLTSPTGTTTLAGTTTQTTLTFSPGTGITNNASGKTTSSPVISTYNETLPSGFTVSSQSGTTFTVNISLTSLQKGTARRANSPYVLSFLPENTNFLNPTVSSVIAANRVSIQFANIAPVAVDDSFTTPGNVTLSGNVLTQNGVDSDADDTALTAQLVSGPATGSLVLNSDGSFTYTPPTPASTTDSTVTFTYQAVDSESLASNTATVTITLLGVVPPNTAPVAQPDAFTTNEDTPLTGNVLADNGSGVDSDADMDPLTATVVSAPSFGTLNLATSGAFTYTPDQDSTGAPNTNQDTFTYQITDGTQVASATATITITPVNDAPTASAIVAASVNEEQGQQSQELLPTGTVTDPDGDALTVSNVSVAITAPSLTNPTLNFTVSGSTLSFDPADLATLDNNEVADVVFTYDISDGTAPAITNTLSIQIIGLDNGVNRVAGAYADTLAARYNNHFLGQNDANASCHTCHQIGQVNADIDSVNDCTSTVFNTYGLLICQARNPAQAPLTDLGVRLSAIEPMFAPRLLSSPSVAVDTSLALGDPVGAVLSADPGKTVDNNTSTIVSFSILNGGTLGPTDASGQFTVDSGGQIRVARAPLTPGVYVVDVRPINDAGQKDNAGNLRGNIPGFFPVDSSSPITITVGLAPPVGVADVVSTDNITPAQIAVLANDTGGAVSSVAVGTAPTNGTAVVQGDLSITYTPNTGFVGTDTFTYVSTNTTASSAATTVTVNVVTAGGAIARDDTATTPLNQPTTVDVLANDGGAGLTARIVTPPANGTATLSGSQITYTPNTGFTGQDVVVYEASNTIAASQANLTITVTGVSGSIFANATNDPELQKVAQALGDTCSAIGGTPGTADAQDLSSVCTTIASDIAGGGNIDPILAAIRNEEALAVGDQLLLTARGTSSTLMRRISRLRAGGQSGLDVSGFSMQIGDETLDGAVLGDLLKAFQGAQNTTGTPSRWGFFVGGDLTLADGDATSRKQGFDLTALSLTAGVDYRFAPGTVAGLALSYSRARTEFSGGGDLDSSSFEGSIYASHDFSAIPGLNLSGVATFGIDQYDQDRAISFTSGGVATNRIASSSYSGTHLNLAVELGYSMPLPQFEGGPELPGSMTVFANADYLVGWIDGYTETGAGGLNLTVSDQTFESLVVSVGFEVAQAYYNSFGVFEPYLRASLNAEVLDDTRSVTSRFSTAGPTAQSFTVSEDGTNSIYGYLEVGSRFKLNYGTLGLSYATTLGRDNLTQHRVSANFETTVMGNDALSLSLNGTGNPTTELGFDTYLGYRLNF